MCVHLTRTLDRYQLVAMRRAALDAARRARERAEGAEEAAARVELYDAAARQVGGDTSSSGAGAQAMAQAHAAPREATNAER